MRTLRWAGIGWLLRGECRGCCLVVAGLLQGASGLAAEPDLWTLDGRYRPLWWQTSICLPDDWQKTLVGKEGSLLYDWPGGYSGFATRLTPGLAEKTEWVRQELVSARVPIVRTIKRVGDIEITEEAFALAPPLAPRKSSTGTGQGTEGALSGVDRKADDAALIGPARHDLILVRVRNLEDRQASVVPRLTIDSEAEVRHDPERERVLIGPSTVVFFSHSVEYTQERDGGLVLSFMPLSVAARGEKTFAYCVARGREAGQFALDVVRAEAARRGAERYWRELDLPYDRLAVPDPAVQGLLESAVRNIYQAREIKDGLPAFQVGPTCYRGLWVVDGAFLLEAMTFLGRTSEARQGMKYLMGFQREDGCLMLIDGHWKETGIALWAITRHARLTGDREWLRQVWPAVERGFSFIEQMRGMPAADAPNAGLVPDGFSDGGLAGKIPEYTNVYWTMAGMRAAVEAARWLGQGEQARRWQEACDDFHALFHRAAERDARVDPQGHRYLPIPMIYDKKVPPQKAQWAFLHSVFPGKVYPPDDPLVRGNMGMLRTVEKQGLVFDTGWLSGGIWTYFGSFYGHAWLWLGEGGKAAETLYAFGNHASPLLAWREEQKPAGQGDQVVGDMPHNWASAEFIRLTRHLLLLERGRELHLFEGFPAKWAGPGCVTKVREVVTEFGQVSLEFTVAEDGGSAVLRLARPRRDPPERVLLHLDHWSGRSGTLEVPADGLVRIKLGRS